MLLILGRDRHIKCDAAFAEKFDGVERGGDCLNCMRTARECIKRTDAGLIIKRSRWTNNKDLQTGVKDPPDAQNPVRFLIVEDASKLASTGRRFRSFSSPNLPERSVEFGTLDGFATFSRHESIEDPDLHVCHRESEKNDEFSPRGDGSFTNLPEKFELPHTNRMEYRSPGLSNPSITDPSPRTIIHSPSIFGPSPGGSLSSILNIDAMTPELSSTLRTSRINILSLLPSPADHAITDPQLAYLMDCFVTESGPWNDIFDEKRRFTECIAHASLNCPPLLAACLSVAAKHLYVIARPGR